MPNDLTTARLAALLRCATAPEHDTRAGEQAARTCMMRLHSIAPDLAREVLRLRDALERGADFVSESRPGETLWLDEVDALHTPTEDAQ